MTAIAKNCVVSIRFVMKNNKGLILENTLKGQPVSYLHGGAAILPLLQEQLQGLHTGDKKRVYLHAAPGLTTEDFVFEVIIDQVRPAIKEELILGYPVQENVQRCEEDCDCYKTQNS